MKRPPTFAPLRAVAPTFAAPGDARPSAAKRGYGRKWRMIRAAFLKAHPRCEACGAGASEADHRTPLAAGGSNAWANLRPLCKPCHSRKTAREDGGFGHAKKSLGVGAVDRSRGETFVSTKLVF